MNLGSRRQTVRYLGLVVTLLIIANCGGGKKSPAAPSPDAPVIANLDLTLLQQTCTVQGLSGTLEVVEFDYTDANGDVSGGQVELVVRKSLTVTGGVPSAGVTITGTTSGHITAALCVAIDGASWGTREVTLTDAAGNRSNTLSLVQLPPP